jgi:very-short-patch-repair endonuclease
MTPQEVRLWLQLRLLRKEGFHFRRQAPMLRFWNSEINGNLDGVVATIQVALASSDSPTLTRLCRVCPSP